MTKLHIKVKKSVISIASSIVNPRKKGSLSINDWIYVSLIDYNND